jgi:hypothetical protein
MADGERPTARELAGSAVDLNGYAVLFKHWASLADKNGSVTVPAARLAAAAEFFERVVDELLTFIPSDKPLD